MTAVENITDKISRLQTVGLGEEKAEKIRQMIYGANQHFKFEIKVIFHLIQHVLIIVNCIISKR